MTSATATTPAPGALTVGVNPYGLTFTTGLQGAGTTRVNPAGSGLEGFIAIATEIGARVLEVHGGWLTELGPAGRRQLEDRLAGLGLRPIVSATLTEGVDTVLRNAVDIGAGTIRLGLSPVLCGARNAYGAAPWAQLIAEIRAGLAQLAPAAEEHGITVAIENHQDFGSAELVSFCQEAGDNVGITFDTGNAFPVAESPLSFARAAASRIRHVHLKDYRVQFTDEGYRLVRCAIGDGAVPFQEIFDILLADGRELTASLEPGALEARHIKLFTEQWWRGYAPKDARSLAETLLAAQVNRLAPHEDYRTPWEQDSPNEDIAAYERAMMLRSAANMRGLGLME